MKFFNSQNTSGKARSFYDTVWLNIDDLNCNFSFLSDNGDRVSLTEFIKANHRKINFAYMGGINECNYLESLIDSNNQVTLTFQLNKVSMVNSTLVVEPVFDLPRAVFKNGSPVSLITLKASKNNNGSYTLISSDFSSSKDQGLENLALVGINDDTFYPLIKVRLDSPATLTIQSIINSINFMNLQGVSRPFGSAEWVEGDPYSDEYKTSEVSCWFASFNGPKATFYVFKNDSSHRFQFSKKNLESAGGCSYYHAEYSVQGPDNAYINIYEGNAYPRII